jgi:hypothetical protein
MLKIITNLQDPLTQLLRDDPVRPAIPTASRIHDYAEVFVLMENDQVAAVTCVAYAASVPTEESQLGQVGMEVAVFYTIWSYAPGAGRRLIRAAQQQIQSARPTVKRFVTLSPKTEMARKFHLTNGASVLSCNQDTVNYEYLP